MARQKFAQAAPRESNTICISAKTVGTNYRRCSRANLEADCVNLWFVEDEREWLDHLEEPIRESNWSICVSASTGKGLMDAVPLFYLDREYEIGGYIAEV